MRSIRRSSSATTRPAEFLAPQNACVRNSVTPPGLDWWHEPIRCGCCRCSDCPDRGPPRIGCVGPVERHRAPRRVAGGGAAVPRSEPPLAGFSPTETNDPVPAGDAVGAAIATAVAAIESLGSIDTTDVEPDVVAQLVEGVEQARRMIDAAATSVAGVIDARNPFRTTRAATSTPERSSHNVRSSPDQRPIGASRPPACAHAFPNGPPQHPPAPSVSPRAKQWHASPPTPASTPTC